MYLLRLASRPWRMAPFSQIFASIGLGFLLVAGALLFWLQEELTPVVERMGKEQVVTAFIDAGLEPQEERQLVDSIKLSLGAKADRADEIRIREPEDFIKDVAKFYPELARELEDLGPEAKTVIPRFVSVPGQFENEEVQKVVALRGVEKVESSKDRYVSIIGAFKTVGWIARVLGVGIFLALMTGLIQLARMNSVFLRESLGVLKFWGAHPWQLLTPSFLSGAYVGALGGVIAFAGWVWGAELIAARLSHLSSILGQLKAPSLSFGITLFLVAVGLGIFSGLVGSRSA